MTTPLRAVSFIKKFTVISAICGFVAAPGLAFSQAQDDQEPTSIQSTRAANAGPWGNSAASNIGTTTIIPSSGTAQEEVLSGSVSSQGNANTPRTSTGGIRIRTGGTAERGGPGGNPDVPFDPNMNLCFLAAGIIFSVWVMRKKLVTKPVSAN